MAAMKPSVRRYRAYARSKLKVLLTHMQKMSRAEWKRFLNREFNRVEEQQMLLRAERNALATATLVFDTLYNESEDQDSNLKN